MGAAIFTIFPVNNQWGVRRESNGCGYVSDEKFDEPIGALLHASSRAVGYFPASIRIPKEHLPAVLESLSDPAYVAWQADGALTCGCTWTGDYSDVEPADNRSDHIGL